MVNFNTEIVYIKQFINIMGHPPTRGDYVTDKGKLHYDPSIGWTNGGIKDKNVGWWLKARKGVFIAQSYMDTCDVDYIAIPTKRSELYAEL